MRPRRRWCSARGQPRPGIPQELLDERVGLGHRVSAARQVIAQSQRIALSRQGFIQLRAALSAAPPRAQAEARHEPRGPRQDRRLASRRRGPGRELFERLPCAAIIEHELGRRQARPDVGRVSRQHRLQLARRPPLGHASRHRAVLQRHLGPQRGHGGCVEASRHLGRSACAVHISPRRRARARQGVSGLGRPPHRKALGQKARLPTSPRPWAAHPSEAGGPAAARR